MMQESAMHVHICIHSMSTMVQGGRCGGSAGAALHERSGFSTKGRTPNIRYLSRNLVLSRFMPFLTGFHRAFNESHLAFIELSMKAILLS